mmetsp:Transcript_3846/g.6722  ORF Transcript_3846/g.6722 Transcript_3846/m.6722 type:complete len:253 (-) Transcript_3846:197-955(-)|eukprot:CAMPEP_0182441588 /NCGR_PEP_ID=MMETSP1172-20130603/550_1 /TAXON_ID=708627 /ORGANISM="Timspurckia oligopyrenoides, Strain CCMP3278" /LENGTH=252 /DNA_ID=CAMNT_0024635957 /DNA_START=175 /DNA_END=933 /DNA_ORIENTATION=-
MAIIGTNNSRYTAVSTHDEDDAVYGTGMMEDSTVIGGGDGGNHETVVVHHHHHYHPANANSVATAQQNATAVELDFTEYARSMAETAKSHFEVMWNNSKPWSEFFDLSRLSIPVPPEMVSRVSMNWEQFKNNYGIVATGMTGLALIHNPFALLIFGGIAVFVSKKIKQIQMEDPTFEHSRGRMIGWSMLGLVGFLVTGVGPAVIGALTTSALFSGLHGLFHRPSASIVEHDVEENVDRFSAPPTAAPTVSYS